MMTDNPNPNEQPEESPSRLRRFGLPVLAVAGAVTAGSFFAPVGLASAQDSDADATVDDTDSNDTDSDDTDTGDGKSEKDSGRRGHRHGARGGALAGVSDAVTDTLGVTTDELRQAAQDGKSLADVADEQGVAVSDLTDALTAEAQARLDEAVAEGKIDEERAGEISDQLAERVDQMVNATADDVRDRMSSAHRAMHKRAANRSENVEQLADFLGLSVDELRQGRADGQTLAEMAEAQGISEDDLVQFLVDGIQERVDEAVAEGRIDADKAAERLADMQSRIEEKVNAEPGENSGFGRGSGKSRFGRDHHSNRHGDQAGDTEEGVQETSA